MDINNPCAFISVQCGSTQCELFRNDASNIQLYAPTRERCVATIELGTQSFVTAEIVARQMGFEPTWN